MTFGERLQALMNKQGLTAYALAKRSGVAKQSLSQMLQGANDPRWETVQRLALALGVDYGELADPELVLPADTPPGKRGRPRKVEAPAIVEVKPAGEAKPSSTS
jgi:transcriptional regulator with XRE-family HTH domain